MRCISRLKQTHLSAVGDGVGQIQFTRALLRELHGEGLSRLAGRDDAGQHRAIYVRVHLLQGALAMRAGELSDAASLLRKAEELRRELTL